MAHLVLPMLPESYFRENSTVSDDNDVAVIVLRIGFRVVLVTATIQFFKCYEDFLAN